MMLRLGGEGRVYGRKEKKGKQTSQRSLRHEKNIDESRTLKRRMCNVQI